MSYICIFFTLSYAKIIKNFNNIIINKDYKYKYFPIGGNIKSEDIIERLQELKNRKIALHIDILESNKITLIRDFLFRFLIMKCYSKEENIIYYGNEIKIKVEITKISVLKILLS